ncbi:MAG: methylenetetrahydrofolate--tRNA-(uracil(54)-C(5))-methyltransferase (FADH(2)-oxidizing) TrmFO [Clostridia bacterium]|nr:methylenetetrahydrofolate--tRNA-(uracil(54)-C(5))-methyltransferase (FADH(2)-oxidizing) TrmFO [Clostridia bacterium]
MKATVIGGGLAGCEAAWTLANAGVAVTLYEMKPTRFSPAHKSVGLAELVCSNSLKARRLESAAGLLKEEMRRLGSLCMQVADTCAVPAGGALAVDRDAFSSGMTAAIEAHPLITVLREECTAIPEDGVVVIASGPLTSDALAEKLTTLCGEGLHFYDAAAPIVEADSVDMNAAFTASRYGREEGDREGVSEGDYINCPMNKEEYEAFWEALVTAERAPLHEFEQNEQPTVYEGCMPIEVLASRGKDAIRFGPMKPVGLRDPRTGHRPWAVLQLRAENREGTLRNLVGFQTNLKFPEQKRVFGMIPALKNAQFVRYGVMHRNTFLNAPNLLDARFSFKAEPRLFFAGQMTGVEGYMESASSGILAGLNAVAMLKGYEPFIPQPDTMMGALAHYISGYEGKDFQPMGANFGVLPPIEPHIRDKKLRYEALSMRGLASLEATKAAHPLFDKK